MPILEEKANQYNKCTQFDIWKTREAGEGERSKLVYKSKIYGYIKM
jgi:hypothetical protein